MTSFSTSHFADYSYPAVHFHLKNQYRISLTAAVKTPNLLTRLAILPSWCPCSLSRLVTWAKLSAYPPLCWELRISSFVTVSIYGRVRIEHHSTDHLPLFKKAVRLSGLTQRQANRYLGAQMGRNCLIREILHALPNKIRLDGRVHEKLAPFIEAAAQKGIGHMVYISGNYLSGMTGATLEGLPVRKIEKMIIASGLKYTIVGPSFFMDNYTTRFYTSMVDRGAITLAAGDGKYSLVAASDVGEFVAEALRQGLTGEYLVTGP